MALDGVSAVAKKRREKHQCYSLYSKSLNKDSGAKSGPRFEVIIWDYEDKLVFKSNGRLSNNYMGSMEAEFKAMKLGLEEATKLGITHISIYCQRYTIFYYLSGRLVPNKKETVLLVNDVIQIIKQFHRCNVVMVNENNVKFASKLARDSMVSQIGRSLYPRQAEVAKKEACVICLDDNIDLDLMFSVDNCGHQFCLHCVTRHIEAKLLDRTIPNCPQHCCKAQLSIDKCGALLTPELSLMWKQMIKEVSTPFNERIHCPYPRCSYLMSKTELSTHDEYGLRRCYKCGDSFCVHCKVPWHNGQTCTDYKKLHSSPQNDGEKLKSYLANLKGWRHCPKCSHIVELSYGCIHMTCICGNSFCYKCGSEWNSLASHRACVVVQSSIIIRVILVAIILILFGVFVYLFV